MQKIIEPIVTIGQALKVTQDCVTIGSMSEDNVEFSKRLNLLADEHKLPPKGGGRQVEMAKIFGVSQKGARKWLEGEALPKMSRIVVIANYFGVNAEWLLSGKGSQREIHYEIPQKNTHSVSERIHNNYYLADEKPLTKLPIISDVMAGSWKEAIDNFHPGDADEWIETSARVSKHSFALRVSGDSMVNPYGSPSIPEGAIVIIDPEIAADNGKIVVAKLQDSNEAILKKLVIDGPNKYLKSLNPDYKPIIIDENCTIIGVARRIEIDL